MRLPTSLALLISKKTTNLFQNVVRIVGSREIAAEQNCIFFHHYSQ